MSQRALLVLGKQVADSSDPTLLQTGRGHSPHSRYAAHRKRYEERFLFLRLNYEEAIRLPSIGGDLRQNLSGATPADAVRRSVDGPRRPVHPGGNGSTTAELKRTT